MTEDNTSAIDLFFQNLIARNDDRTAAVDQLHTHLRNAGVLSKVTLHRYICPRNCGPIAIVFRASGATFCAVRDYKFSPGLNARVSVPAAREKNTLNGDNHWPGHVHELEALAGWGDVAGFDVNCRHHRETLTAARVLADCAGAIPGHPGKPTRLGGVS